MRKNMRPKNLIHPGEILVEEFLLPANRSQLSLASDLGWTTARLNEVIKGRRSVTADAALDLARVLKTSPELWLNLQMTWDLKKAKLRRAS